MANVIEACKRAQAKLVFFDNVYMYGKVDGPMTEEHALRPLLEEGRGPRADRHDADGRGEGRRSDRDDRALGRLLRARHNGTACRTSLVLEPLAKGRKPSWLVDAIGSPLAHLHARRGARRVDARRARDGLEPGVAPPHRAESAHRRAVHRDGGAGVRRCAAVPGAEPADAAGRSGGSTPTCANRTRCSTRAIRRTSSTRRSSPGNSASPAPPTQDGVRVAANSYKPRA